MVVGNISHCPLALISQNITLRWHLHPSVFVSVDKAIYNLGRNIAILLVVASQSKLSFTSLFASVTPFSYLVEGGVNVELDQIFLSLHLALVNDTEVMFGYVVGVPSYGLIRTLNYGSYAISC
jgi:hypothetical protein